jgi:hypothetical protein
MNKLKKLREIHMLLFEFAYEKGRNWGTMGSMKSEYENWLDEFYELDIKTKNKNYDSNNS